LSVACATLFAHAASGAEQETPFRFGFAGSMFTDLAEADARAAIRVWSKIIGDERNVPVDPDAAFIHGVEDLVEAMQQHRIDAAVMSAPDFAVVRERMPLGRAFFGLTKKGWEVEYLLLVHAASDVHTVPDLAGKKINIFSNPRMSLADAWLEVLLREHGHLAADRHFAVRTSRNKLSAVILPVFFRAVDACLVTRDGFEIMSELNPQVGRQLRAIEVSEVFSPFIVVFRGDYDSRHQEAVYHALEHIHETPAGQQILNVFQFERLEPGPVSRLDSALALLRRRAALESTSGLAHALAPPNP
jgi:phosphonate transport system substrate-binding protein